jgi:predicted metal-dependent HD superfamily phosphohydrolase
MWEILDDKVESERIKKLKKYVSEFLSTATFDKFYYHNLIHTTDVYNSTKTYAEMEKIDEKSNELLLAAALLHDVGYARQYDSNEPIGAMMAEEILPNYGFDKNEIAIVQKLIMATVIPQRPKDELEYIICDADFDTLGTDRFLKRSLDLKREIEEKKGKEYTDTEWYKNQLALLESHRYFTASARKLREEGQKANIKKLKELIANTKS